MRRGGGCGTSHVCITCNGTVHQVMANIADEKECCGTDIFLRTTHSCCNADTELILNRLNPVENNVGRACCFGGARGEVKQYYEVNGFASGSDCVAQCKVDNAAASQVVAIIVTYYGALYGVPPSGGVTAGIVSLTHACQVLCDLNACVAD